ncbi:hypothetical protein SADUNF_Sadunf08G0173700 [Salix dunnii]|uniref:Serine aminopeptidase S33 domain-containing protein n=1 Tax=Salix dunnii TaxID=1413687 RepID=A0A835K0S3_9ROSI|nr:hypothetical protein SADUNF_Sadunf08G0173700 [Salix dunnii]
MGTAYLCFCSGCRVASEAAIVLLPLNIIVFTLDFSGSGLSGGDYKDDLMAVVDYLRQDGNVSLIGLCGRSVGAVTSLMYEVEDPSTAGMVLHSLFSDLVGLMMELVGTYRFPLPKFTVKFAIHHMRKAIQKKARFDIMDLNLNGWHLVRETRTLSNLREITTLHAPNFILIHEISFSTMSYNLPRMRLGEHTLKWCMITLVRIVGAHCTEQAVTQNHQLYQKVPLDIQHKDNQSEVEREEIGDDHLPSSSKIISFELSNGHPHGPHSPTTMDDDHYVEYQLDDVVGSPCDMEEEESVNLKHCICRMMFFLKFDLLCIFQMFMEAVIESLKDLELRHPKAGEQMASVGPASVKSSQKDNQDAYSIVKHGNPLKTLPTPTSVKQHMPLKTESASSSTVNHQNLATEDPSPDTSASSVVTPFDNPPSIMKSERVSTSSSSDTSGSVHGSTDTDFSDNTKATLTVEQNPANHLMDGLLCRWDFNLFRNGR